MGFPIRKSMDQSSFAAPHGLSQRITSFIACACQGIHQLPLRHLIVLIANAHHQLPFQRNGQQTRLPFTTRSSHDAIDVFDPVTLLELRRAAHLCQILRPASRDLSGSARSGNAHQHNIRGYFLRTPKSPVPLAGNRSFQRSLKRSPTTSCLE